jgi:cysteinyl-tRNA synthetase
MCDDMNTPRASAALFMLVGVGEKAVKNSAMSPAEANLIVNAILRMDAVFGVFYEVPQAYFTPPADGSGLQSSSDVKAALDAGSIPPRVAELAEKRALLKSQKLFAEADEARAEIAALGYEVKDKKTEFEIYKL